MGETPGQLVMSAQICYHSRCIKSWEFHANLLFIGKVRWTVGQTDVARQSNPNPLNAGIFLSVANEFRVFK
mgnify:CR=1